MLHSAARGQHVEGARVITAVKLNRSGVFIQAGKEKTRRRIRVNGFRRFKSGELVVPLDVLSIFADGDSQQYG